MIEKWENNRKINRQIRRLKAKEDKRKIKGRGKKEKNDRVLEMSVDLEMNLNK